MKMLYFRGKGNGCLSGKTEYIMLVEDGDLEDGDIDGYTSPGFNLVGMFDVTEDKSMMDSRVEMLPTGESMVDMVNSH